MVQIIGDTGIGDSGVGETGTAQLHTSRPNYHFLRFYVNKIITYLKGYLTFPWISCLQKQHKYIHDCQIFISTDFM